MQYSGETLSVLTWNTTCWRMSPYLLAWVFVFIALWLINSVTFNQILRALDHIHVLIRLNPKLQMAHREVL